MNDGFDFTAAMQDDFRMANQEFQMAAEEERAREQFEQDQQELEQCIIDAIHRASVGLSTWEDAVLLANFCRVKVPGVTCELRGAA